MAMDFTNAPVSIGTVVEWPGPITFSAPFGPEARRPSLQDASGRWYNRTIFVVLKKGQG